MKYTGAHCPVCDKRFAQNDDIVVCPVCGAPHHRTCYQQENHCALEQMHLTGQTWHPSGQQSDSQDTQEDSTKCGFCGIENSQTALFCKSCGSSLAHKGTSTANTQQSAFGQRATVSFSNSLQGLSPDEEIDGISVRDLSLFVGSNAAYFLPQFKQIASGQKMSFNFPAMFFHHFYYMFRKMYIPAFILLGVALIAQIPFFLVLPELTELTMANMDMMFNGLVLPEFVFSDAAQNILNFSDYTSYLVFAAQVILSLLANRIYFHTVKKRIRKIKEHFTNSGQNFDDHAYTQALSKGGGTSFVIPILYAIAVFVAHIIIVSIIMIYTLAQLGNY